MAGAGVKTEAHGLSHEQVIGGMQPYGGADHAEGHSAEYPDDIDQAKAEMEIARDATMALQFLEQVRSEFRAEDDDRGYAEFCRVRSLCHILRQTNCCRCPIWTQRSESLHSFAL